MLANQLLLLRFLVSVAPYLTRGAVPAYAANEKKARRTDSDSDDDDDADAAADADADADALFVPPADAARPLAPPARQGAVLITVRDAAPYTQWNVPLLGKRLRTVLPAIAAAAPALPKAMHAPSVQDAERHGAAYTLWRSFAFYPEDWPGYAHRRTIGWIEGLSTSHNEDLRRPPAPGAPGAGACRTYELGLAPA